MTAQPPIFATLGCRLNAYETEAMKTLAEGAGVEGAVVVNTCAVTAEAVRKARQEIRGLRRENPAAKLIVTGCAAQTEPETFAGMAEVDLVVGNAEKMEPATWARLGPDFVGETERVQVDDIMSVTETAGHLIDGFGRHRAYVQVQNGCDHACTFCVIPQGRGPSRSLTIAQVLADCSVAKASPERWARAVAEAARGWNADRVVAEANQGGQMVASVLRAADIALPLKLVHASIGKAARAEPVAALYEAGRVRHAGMFAQLEDQLCGLMAGGGYEGPGRSPDRADALVWALSELMLGLPANPRVRQV